jgi:hypothetical protein
VALAISKNERYIFNMTISQTVEIPADHRLVFEMLIPDDVPAGIKGRLTFTSDFDLQQSFAMPMSAAAPKGTPRPARAVKIAPKEFDREKADAAHKSMCGMFKTDGHDVERFLAWKQSERELEWEIDEQRDKKHIAAKLRNSVVNKNINPEIRAAANRKLCGCQAGGDGHDVERFLERKRFEREHEYEIEERQREESKKWQMN